MGAKKASGQRSRASPLQTCILLTVFIAAGFGWPFLLTRLGARHKEIVAVKAELARVQASLLAKEESQAKDVQELKDGLDSRQQKIELLKKTSDDCAVELRYVRKEMEVQQQGDVQSKEDVARRRQAEVDGAELSRLQQAVARLEADNKQLQDSGGSASKLAAPGMGGDCSGKDAEIQRLDKLVKDGEKKIEKLKFTYQVLWQSQAAPKNDTRKKESEEDRAVNSFKDERTLSIEKVMAAANEAIAECHSASNTTGGLATSSIGGSSCNATQEDLQQYLDYTVGEVCPNDWFFVQSLIFEEGCFSLPRRRCFAVMPETYTEPLPQPECLWAQEALDDLNVRWDHHECKSFSCLNERKTGDCLNCFNMTLEFMRWRSRANGVIPMKDVVRIKKGTLRIGLDFGGRSGSFAARMSRWNITIVTTQRNKETAFNKDTLGLPYMETIALRGLIPLHIPNKARLPFFDGTLDVVHSSSSLRHIKVIEFEELMYEWDRILRPGGIIWVELFYQPVNEMPLYIRLIENLKYKHLYFNVTRKPGNGTLKKPTPYSYLTCVVEKPLNRT